MRFRMHIRACAATCKIAALLALALPARAQEAPAYDAFAKALAPFASVVFGGEGQPGAFMAECNVSAATGTVATAQGMHLRLALQRPDHFRADLAGNGQILTACRAGGALWATPEEPMRALAQAAGLDTSHSGPDATPAPLIPLTIDPKMLGFLPVIFDVKDEGSEDIGGEPHRILRFGLMPDVRKATKAGDFDARAWIDGDSRPRRVIVKGPDYSIQIEVEKLVFAPKFPDKAWHPPEGQQVLKLPASALNGLFEKMLAHKIELPGAPPRPPEKTP